MATTVLGLAWLASLAAWPLYGTWLPLVLMSVVNFAYAHKIFLRWERAAEAIEKAGAELRLLAEVLALLEREDLCGGEAEGAAGECAARGSGGVATDPEAGLAGRND